MTENRNKLQNYYLRKIMNYSINMTINILNIIIHDAYNEIVPRLNTSIDVERGNLYIIQ